MADEPQVEAPVAAPEPSSVADAHASAAAALAATPEAAASAVVEAVETPAPVDWGARIEEWGGADETERAVNLWRTTGTPEGLRQIFVEAGEAFGFTKDQIADFLSGKSQQVAAAPAAPAAPAVDPIAEILSDPDRVLTAADWRALEADREAKAAAAAAAANQELTQQQIIQQGVNTIVTTVGQTWLELAVTDEVDQAAIIALAERQLGEIDHTVDPGRVHSALLTAYQTYTDRARSIAAAAVEAKAQQSAVLPQALPQSGGSAGSGPPQPEPMDVRSSFAAARAALGLSVSGRS